MAMTMDSSYPATRFAPQQLVGAALQASLFIAPTAYGLVVLARAAGFGTLVASQTSILLLAGVVWLLLAASAIGSPPPATARPKIFAILGDPTLSIGVKLRATLTNWFSLLAIASQLLMLASLTL
jgi:hypothetical protein